MDAEETIEEQEKRIVKYRENGYTHVTEEWRVAEITIDLVLKATAQVAGNKVDGSGRFHCERDGQTATTRENLRDQKMPPKTLLEEAPSSWKTCEICVPKEACCRTHEWDKELQGYGVDVGDVEVVCNLCNSAPGTRKRTRRLKTVARGREWTASVVSIFKY